ncbi:hypothetical protein DBR11_19250 [Pedobacter sp. HMWF019]|uniref:sensor histidine kinase n=1 Tax=Pedobacter sp. HMWF019 TaxID=2056856 RepID=UPI000D364083|nr:HAMP domain-containing sensor histidine kinase [Pedobacter sp. HMWF019]PTS96360.1 hypothetical protein DBR11_19250 [Pedobacter sp. HMWF019]
MKNILNNLFNTGLPPEAGFIQEAKTKSHNQICLICAFVGLIFSYIGRDSFPYLVNMLVLTAIFLTGFLLSYFLQLKWSVYFISVTMTLWIIEASMGFGSELGEQNYLIITIVSIAIYYSSGNYRFFRIAAVIGVFIFIKLYQKYNAPFFPLPAAADYIYAFNICMPYVIVCVICLNMVRKAQHSQQLIEKQKAVLLDAIQFKDQVFSIIGHDMRSPLISTKNMLQLLEQDILPPDDRKTFFNQLHSSIDVSVTTLENLLHWASGKQRVQHKETNAKEINLFPMIEQVMAFYQYPAQHKKITFINEVPDPTYAIADVEQIAFVIRNLTSNAIKFSYIGQQIIFQVEYPDTDTVLIRIKDHGTGIEPDVLRSLFDLGKRYSTNGTTNEKGTGLGLVFCKEFIENNNGNIWIESEPGYGTTIKFSLRKTTI